MKYYIQGLKKYATFKGRATRSEFWYFTLFTAIVGGILLYLDFFVTNTYGTLMSLYAIATFLPNLAISVRRLHDVGKSGWMYLIAFVPLIGGIWLFVLYVTDSKPDNEYGPNPKGSSAQAPQPQSF